MKRTKKPDLQGDGKTTFRRLGKCPYRHDFNADEFKEEAEQLTRAMREVELKEEAIKAAAATAKAELRQLKADVNERAAKLRNGYETRTADAIIVFDREAGVRRCYFNAPGQPHHERLIEERAMTENELGELPLSMEDGAEPIEDPLKIKEAEAPAAPAPGGN